MVPGQFQYRWHILNVSLMWSQSNNVKCVLAPNKQTAASKPNSRAGQFDLKYDIEIFLSYIAIHNTYLDSNIRTIRFLINNHL